MERQRPYTEDGRQTIASLYEQYEKLVLLGFERKLIFWQSLPKGMDEQTKFPIYGYTKGREGEQHLWLISGVHGEEPPGPEAIAAEVDFLAGLSDRIPMVIIPLCNPVGRYLGWRYQDAYRDHNVGTSVSDSEHLLLKSGESTPRTDAPSNETSKYLTSFVVELSMKRPPLLSIDFHEDEALPKSYIYSQGMLGVSDPVAKEIVEIMQNSGMEIQTEGKTRFDEDVVEGVVTAQIDGSIDELMATETIFYRGAIIKKPKAKTAIVVETPTIGVPLSMRVRAHRNIIQQLPRLWKMMG